MYFYELTYGYYSGTYNIVLFHEKKFTKREYAEMYHSVLGEKSNDVQSISESLCERYGFKEAKPETGIYADYGPFSRIKEEEITSKNTHMDAQGKWDEE